MFVVVVVAVVIVVVGGGDVVRWRWKSRRRGCFAKRRYTSTSTTFRVERIGVNMGSRVKKK